MPDSLESRLAQARAAARAAAESTVVLCDRIIEAEKVITAARAYVDGIERPAPDDEMLRLTTVFVGLVRNYGVRTS